MPNSTSDKIINTLTSISLNYHRLLLLIGKSGSGKTEILKDVSTRIGDQRQSFLPSGDS